MPNQSEPRLNRSGVATRARIIEAALAILAEQGYAELTLQAVANRAGVLYGSVTHHYKTREKLVDSMLETLLTEYRQKFEEFARTLPEGEGCPIVKLVTWLLDDSVEPGTSGTFLELWALGTHDGKVAAGANKLYDDVIEDCVAALGAERTSPKSQPLRESLYLLGTVVEGSSALFSTRDHQGSLYRAFRRDAMEVLVPLLQSRLDYARS